VYAAGWLLIILHVRLQLVPPHAYSGRLSAWTTSPMRVHDDLPHVGPAGEFLLCLGGLVQGEYRSDNGLDLSLASQGHEPAEVRGRVHGGSDHLSVVQVQTAYVECHPVSAECTGNDPPAALTQQGQ
jgi:hypothetical protein